MRPDSIPRPGNGPDTILRWLRVLHHGTGVTALWAALTADLRLTVAQHYLVALGRSGDDDRAARLASLAMTEPGVRDMVQRQCQAWRTVLLSLVHGVEVVSARPFGASMEVITLAPAAARGRHLIAQGDEHRFLIQHHDRETSVAAVGTRLPVPGWPPEQWIVPNLPPR